MGTLTVSRYGAILDGRGGMRDGVDKVIFQSWF